MDDHFTIMNIFYQQPKIYQIENIRTTQTHTQKIIHTHHIYITNMAERCLY